MTPELPEGFRESIAQLSPDELRQLLASLLAAGTPADAWAPARPDPVELADPPAEPLALTVRCDVDDTRPPVWRRLVLHGDLTLDQVHDVLQAAFSWQDYHLHRFFPGPKKQLWTGPFFTTRYDEESGEEDTEGMQPEAGVRLDQVLREPGDRLFYAYDFGDSWEVTIKLESIAPLDPASDPAVCRTAQMAGPLEDCGGIPGHQELVEGFKAGGIAGLEEDLQTWVPEGWDPFAEDADSVNERLALVGKTAEELLAALSQKDGDTGASWPPALEPLVARAPLDLVQDLAVVCAQARESAITFGELSPDDVTALARPYRHLVHLAGDDGIPLTQAGWMRPVVVEQIYRELGYDGQWIGKGNREDQTHPVASLRERCQTLGLLRKYKGRLLRTTAATRLVSDEDYLRHVASRLIGHKDRYAAASQAVFALHCAATGEADYGHGVPAAEALTRIGMSTTPGGGVEPEAALSWSRDLWDALMDAAGHRSSRTPTEESRRRVAGLARLALWPEG